MQTTIDHNMTDITTTLWNLPKERRNKVLSITEFIFQTKVGGILNYNPMDTNYNNTIRGSFNNIIHPLYGINPSFENSHDRYFISILYNNKTELFQYLLNNMDNTNLIETLPPVFDYIVDDVARETVLRVLNSVITINLIKVRLYNELYWDELRRVFIHYANHNRAVSNYFNLSYISGIMCGRISVNKMDDVNHEMSSIFVPISSFLRYITNTVSYNRVI